LTSGMRPGGRAGMSLWRSVVALRIAVAAVREMTAARARWPATFGPQAPVRCTRASGSG